jgi:hypothetical protein
MSSTRDIVQQYLIENGFEGLSFADQCCCKVGNLMNCVGKKDRFCFVDSCEPCNNIQETAQKIIKEGSLNLHPIEQSNTITAIANNMEPEFIW